MNKEILLQSSFFRSVGMIAVLFFFDIVVVTSAFAENLTSQVIPRSYFGMHFIDRNAARPDNVGALGKGTLVIWPYIERSRGRYDWSNLDAWVARAEALGVDFDYSFGPFPEWAVGDPSKCIASAIPNVRRCGAMPRDLADWDRYVTAVASRYKGRIAVYEIWNEPEHDTAISPREMALLARRAVNIIRSIDPAAKIAGPSLNGRHARWASSYFGAGGPRDVDVVALHTYTGTQTNYPETIDRRFTGPGAIFAPLIPLLSHSGLAGKPLWSTEGAWSDRPNSLSDPEDQAAFTARALLIHWANGFSRYYWYAYDHTTIGRLLGTRAGVAYRAVRSWMEGARMTELCAPTVLDGDVWSCKLERPGGERSVIMWSLSGEKHVKVSLDLRQSVDIDGIARFIDNGVATIDKVPVRLKRVQAR